MTFVKQILKSRRLHSAAFFVVGCVLLSGCAEGLRSGPELIKALPDNHKYYRGDFRLCHGYGCRIKTRTYISSDEWKTVQVLFQKIETASQERTAIANALGKIEYIVGERTGTSQDRAKAPIILSDNTQLDCVDESINTTNYIQFLIHDDLLKFHTLHERPAHRGTFVDGLWPHNAAVINDVTTGQDYVMDSWFRDNGKPAYIVPLQEWVDGWQPKEK